MPRKSKKSLVKRLVDLGKDAVLISDLDIETLEQMIAEAESVSPAIQITSADGSKKIDETDPEWSDYVISQLTDKECKDGMPTCDGLRRIFKKLIGRIVSVDIDVLKSPTMSDRTATVRCSIQFKRHGVISARDEYVSDVFDVNPDNTPFPYCNASVATASTKAEARALRKALGLVRVYALEEVNQGVAKEDLDPMVIDENRPISDSAKIVINTMCNRMGIDQSKLIKFCGIQTESMHTLTYKQSHEVINILNGFSRGTENGGQSIPEQIKGEVIF
jgi:hypothetical protein